MEFLYSISLVFNDIVDNKIKRLSIINGIFWAVVWGVLSLILWHPLVNLTTTMINLLPFKFLQNAGADFILMILWIQAVLITLGIFFSLFNQVLSKKIIPIFIALVVAILWFIVFFIYQDTIITYLQKLIKIFPFETIEEAVSIVFTIFILYSLYIASIYISFLFLSVKSLEELKEKEYPTLKTDKSFSIFKLAFIAIRDLVLFIIALFVLYPILFIPFVNIILILFLWGFLIKESLLQTVFMIFGEEKINNKEVWVFSILSVIFNFIPIVNLFAPAFGVLSMYHYVMEKKIDEN